MHDFINDPRFAGIEKFSSKVWLSSPTMHGDEQRWVDEAIQTNWVSTVGANIDAVEKMTAEKVGRKFAVALSAGTAALHLAIKLCAEKLYGSLEGKRVFASDMTFDATVNPICYEGGIPVFIDTERDTWNMDPVALEKAFELYPEVKLIVVAHLYGTPGKIDEIKAIADAHGALIVEDAAESFGATYKGVQTGCFGTESILSGNGNKIVTGSSGGFLLTDEKEDANKAKLVELLTELGGKETHDGMSYSEKYVCFELGEKKSKWLYFYDDIDFEKLRANIEERMSKTKNPLYYQLSYSTIIIGYKKKETNKPVLAPVDSGMVFLLI